MNNTPNGTITPGFSKFISLAAQHIRERESEILNDLDDPILDDAEFMDTEDTEPAELSPVEDEPSESELNNHSEPIDDSKPSEEEFMRDSSEDNESILSEEEDEDSEGQDDTAQSLKKEGDEKVVKGLWKEAIERYTKALKCREMAALYGNRSLCYMKVGEFDKAERDCCNAIELDPFYKRIYRRRAAIRLRRRDYFGSAQDLQSLRILSYNAHLDPIVLEEYKTLLPLARLTKTDGPSTARVGNLEKVVLAQLCQIEEATARAFKARSMWSQVVESLSMAIIVSPTTPRLYYERAAANFKLGKANLAEADCTEAIDLEPSNPTYYRLRADVRKKLGKLPESQSDEETAWKLAPTSEALSRLEEPTRPKEPEAPAPVRPQTPTEETSNFVRIPVKDVYTSNSQELLDLSKLPDGIRVCFFS